MDKMSKLLDNPPPDGVLYTSLNGPVYITGCGAKISNLHSPEQCSGRACVIHAPSEHNMRHFRTHWRNGGLFDIKPPHMERICEHGIGHPDPDDAAFWEARGEDIGVHGCDGCCRP